MCTAQDVQAVASGKVRTYRVDVACQEDVSRVAAQTLAAVGSIDVLVNNAGTQSFYISQYAHVPFVARFPYHS